MLDAAARDEEPRRSMSRVEFFFDLSSPWTRLAFHNIQPLLAEAGASATWRPILVGGVFNAVNPAVYAGRADPDSPRQRHSWTWLKAWARLAGVPMSFPSPHHPLRSVLPMRACCVLESEPSELLRFAEAAFDAYFRAERNLDDPAVLRAVADGCGLTASVSWRPPSRRPPSSGCARTPRSSSIAAASARRPSSWTARSSSATTSCPWCARRSATAPRPATSPRADRPSREGCTTPGRRATATVLSRG